MKRKLLYGCLAFEAVLCVLMAVCRSWVPELFSEGIAFPLEQIGYGLRQLSLSGSAGNAVAIGLYVVLSLVPLVFLIGRKLHWEDSLLASMSALLFLSLYCMINPGLLSQWAGNPLGVVFEKAILGAFFYALVVGYVVLRLLRSFFAAEQEKLTLYLHVLLGGLSVLLVYAAFGSGFAGLLDSIAVLQAGNVGNEHLLGGTYVFLSLQYAADVLPYLLDLVIVYAVGVLLDSERYSENAILAAEKLARLCRLSLIIMVVSNLAYHGLQLLFVKSLMQTNSVVQLPLFSLLFVLAVLLVTKLLGDNKQLKEDNDLFI